MPSRNTIRSDSDETYYHIYARGGNKRPIFLDVADYLHFENLLARYLSQKPKTSKSGESYPCYSDRVELLTYCLMPNHFHILLYQNSSGSVAKFMQSLMISYGRYFNLKYKRTGPIFESRYKSSKIDTQSYLEHISRYIHLNPRYWKHYPYSSLHYYIKDTPEWLRPQKITELFKNIDEYQHFLADYEDHKQMFKEIKHEVAQ